MKLAAVSVSSNDIKKSVKFYKILGFKFEKHKADDKHVETIPKDGIKLMIDKEDLVESILGEKPHPANHSSFAVLYDSPKEVDNTAKKLKEKGFNIHKEPWDAFWGQRYAIIKDPSGYLIDLYAYL